MTVRELEGTKTDFVTEILLSDIKPTEFCFIEAPFFVLFFAWFLMHNNSVLHYDPLLSQICHFVVTAEVCSEATNVKEKFEK